MEKFMLIFRHEDDHAVASPEQIQPQLATNTINEVYNVTLMNYN
jgi:hypothetical protein